MFPLRTSVPNREVPSVVIALIVANVAVYLVQAGLPADPAAQFIRDYGLVPARYTDPAHGSFSRCRWWATRSTHRSRISDPARFRS